MAKMRCGVLWVTLALLLAVPTAAQGQVTVDDLMRLRSISDVQISPDGNQVAYVVSTPNLETAEHEAVLYRVAAGGGAPQRLTYGTHIFNRPLPAPWLRWTPDGTLLSFVAYVNGAPQVMAMPAERGEPWPVTAFPQGVTRYEWSPNGKQIAFLAADPAPADETQRIKEKSFVVRVDRSVRFPRIWLQDVPSGSPHALTPPDEAILDFHWSPDGANLVYSASDQLNFLSPYNSVVYTIAAGGGEPRAIVRRPGTNRMAQYSPDGRLIAFVSSGGHAGMMNALDLYVVAADGSGQPRGLTVAKEVWVSQFVWAPDSRSILYTPQEQTNDSGEHMFEQAVFRVPVDGGQSEVVTTGRVVNYSMSLSRDGRRLAFRSVESRTMGDVVIMDTSSGRATKLTEVNPELRAMKLGDLEPVHWKSFDGKEIWGLLLTPPGYKAADHRLPLLVYCHGGPIGGYTYGIFPQFAHIPGQVDPYPVEAMASAGFAVLFPMPRGGSGYGVAGFRAIVNRWGEDDYKDIMTGVDAMIAQGIADSERLGVMGASYGGYMTDWIVTQTNRFKAASTAASISDLANLYYFSEAGDTVTEYYGFPWENSEAMSRHSAISYVRNVTTPLLIQHGENDNRVPLNEAQEFYKALKALHKTVEFDIYPRGSHVNVEPPLEREYMRRNLEWFTRWLKPDSPAASAARDSR